MFQTSLFQGCFVALLVALTACSKAVGGPVEGAADAHCGGAVTTTDQAVCSVAGNAPVEEEQATRFGTEGDDDDCKYHVAWSATDIVTDEDVTLTITLTSKASGAPVTGADPEVEIYLDAKHPAPNTARKTTETKPGTYEIGPVQFDASGKWTVQYHFFETCSDVDEASPHGHIAFFVSVP